MSIALLQIYAKMPHRQNAGVKKPGSAGLVIGLGRSVGVEHLVLRGILHERDRVHAVASIDVAFTAAVDANNMEKTKQMLNEYPLFIPRIEWFWFVVQLKTRNVYGRSADSAWR